MTHLSQQNEMAKSQFVCAVKKIVSIYSSEDGACLTPDRKFTEKAVIDAWSDVRRLLGLNDDLK